MKFILSVLIFATVSANDPPFSLKLCDEPGSRQQRSGLCARLDIVFEEEDAACIKSLDVGLDAYLESSILYPDVLKTLTSTAYDCLINIKDKFAILEAPSSKDYAMKLRVRSYFKLIDHMILYDRLVGQRKVSNGT
jgi:hypothetical protein